MLCLLLFLLLCLLLFCIWGGTLLRENWTSSISPWTFVGTDLSTVSFRCYVQTFIPQASPTALPLMKIRLQSKNTSNIEFVSQSLFIPYTGDQRLICLIIWWPCYVCRVLLMVMRNEEGYLSVNCKPSLCDSLLVPLTQLQRPNTEESSGHVCNTESSTGLFRHLTVQRFHPILRACVAYLPIRAAVWRTPTATNYSAGGQEIGQPWEWRHTGQNAIFLSHATAVWDLCGGALVTVPSASRRLGKHAIPELSP